MAYFHGLKPVSFRECIKKKLFAWYGFTHRMISWNKIYPFQTRLGLNWKTAGHFALPAWLWWVPSVGCYCCESFWDWVRQGQCRLCVDIPCVCTCETWSLPWFCHAFPQRNHVSSGNILFYIRVYVGGTKTLLFEKSTVTCAKYRRSWKGILTSCVSVAPVLGHEQLFTWFHGQFLKWINSNKPW